MPVAATVASSPAVRATCEAGARKATVAVLNVTGPYRILKRCTAAAERAHGGGSSETSCWFAEGAAAIPPVVVAAEPQPIRALHLCARLPLCSAMNSQTTLTHEQVLQVPLCGSAFPEPGTLALQRRLISVGYAGPAVLFSLQHRSKRGVCTLALASAQVTHPLFDAASVLPCICTLG